MRRFCACPSCMRPCSSVRLPATRQVCRRRIWTISGRVHRFALYRAAHVFHGDRGVTFGLFAKICIVNGIADSLRYIRGKGTMLSMEDLDEREQPDGDEPNPQSLLLDKEQVWESRRQIKAMLSPLEYEIFEMYISRFSYAGIASRIGKSQKSVDNALCRIKKKLRQNLKQPT